MYGRRQPRGVRAGELHGGEQVHSGASSLWQRAEVGADKVIHLDRPFSGSEDFSFFGKLTNTPSAFMMIDAGHGEHMVSLHNGKIVFDENVMRSGVAGMSAVALKYLAE